MNIPLLSDPNILRTPLSEIEKVVYDSGFVSYTIVPSIAAGYPNVDSSDATTTCSDRFGDPVENVILKTIRGFESPHHLYKWTCGK